MMINEIRRFFSLFTISLCIIVASCASEPTFVATEPVNDPILKHEVHLTPFQHNINIALNRISAKDAIGAIIAIDKAEKKPLLDDDIILLAYTKAKLLVLQNNINDAYNTLNNNTTEQHIVLANQNIQLHTGLLKASLLKQKGLHAEAFKLRIFLSPLIKDAATFQKNNKAIWQTLNKLPENQLNENLNNAIENEAKQWLLLNAISRNKFLSLDEKITQIDIWLSLNIHHPAANIEFPEIANIKSMAKSQRKKIAVILPFNGKFSAIAEAIRDGIMFSYFDSKRQSEVQFYSASETDSFITTYNKAVTEGAEIIIGPLFKNHLEELYALESLPVETIALNKLSVQKKHINLLELSLSPEEEISSIIKNAQTKNINNALILSQDDEYSQKNLALFLAEWQALGKNIILQHTFSVTTELALQLERPLNIEKSNQRIENLKKLLDTNLETNPKSRTDIDCIILLTKTEGAREINSLISFYLPNNIIKYANSTIYKDFDNKEINNDLEGIIFTDTPLAIDDKTTISALYKNSPLLRMHALGMDALQIASRLNLTQNQSFTFDGATGEIQLSDNTIFRTTPFAIFVDGTVERLENISALKE
jgi:hypothetical protein